VNKYLKMSKTSYKNTKELIADLSQKIDLLDKGSLRLEDLNSLVESGKDLYEHLVILRYKAFDKFDFTTNETVKPSKVEKPSPAAKVEAQVGTALEMSFDFTSFEPEQPKLEPIETTVIPQPTQLPPMEVFKDEPQQVIVSAGEIPDIKEQVTPLKSVAPPVVPPMKLTEGGVDANSLNDAFKEEDDQSLRKKLEKTPISDLRPQISIGKKFEYISLLFLGDAADYDKSIDFLNNASTWEVATDKIEELKLRYKWDMEDRTIQKFIELVERRYL
jgi:hypothetical protein